KPDVIITRFPLDDKDTHGHHTASAHLALEAFKAAQWKAKRIVWNAWVPDPKEKLDLSNALHIDSSPYSPLLGVTFGELAADSRSQHKSQGFGAAPLHGSQIENFLLLGGEPGKTGLFDGVDLTWKRVSGSREVARLLKDAADGYKLDKPSASLPVLLK